MSTFNEAIKCTDNRALVEPDSGLSLSYRELSHIVGHLQLMFLDPKSPLTAVPRQAAVGISLPNGLEFVAAFLAVTMDAKVAAPLNPNYKAGELDFYLEDLQTSMILVPKGTTRAGNTEIQKAAQKWQAMLVELAFSPQRGRVEFQVFSPKDNFTSAIYDSVERVACFFNVEKGFPGSAKAEDVALILHTSGTTSKPKTVPLLHSNIVTSMRNISKTYRLSPKDNSYVVMPLFHVHGLIGVLLSSFYAQGSVIVPPRFSAGRFWADFVKYKANWFSCVPTISQIMLNVEKPSPLPEIRFIRSCSSALAPSTLHRLEKEFRAPVVEAYAMTEAAHQMTSNELPPGKRKPGTVGKPQGVEVVILNEKDEVLSQGQQGEVSIRGPNVTPGYRNNPKANEENFTRAEHYFRTGDQGFFDEDGFLVLTGRLKELINRGGEKISPLELDAVMLSHPAVDEAISYGVANSKYGQVVHAAVVLRAGQKLDYEGLASYMKEKLAPFKVPERVFFVDKLPKTATGKVQRRMLAEVFSSKSKL
ncbi:AaceriAAR168Cp [[Ashbya] aceris (nom. inval.)]|nr:AaceriAAR168Cp [[Ashbya] aceris (nom. inval.)]